MRSARRHRLLWIVCVCLVPRLVLADAAQARVHFDRGRTYFEVNDYRKAIAEFKAAHIEKPDPAFLYNIAECHQRLGEASEALLFYQRFLAIAPPDDKTRPVVEQRIADLKTVADATRSAPGDRPTGGENVPLVLKASPPPGDPAGGVLTDQSAARQPTEGAPIYTRPWFLITVGAVVVGSAVSIWALSRSPEPPSTPLGNQSVF
jgi:tetratricopeptide (TPR) repeat protein